MKKVIPILFIFFVIYAISNKEEILIPDYAIRFRIIANSNSESDQELKMTIKADLDNVLSPLMSEAKTSKEAKDILEENMDTIENIVNKYGVVHTISLGKNYFPEKEYKGVYYDEGYYESLLVTIGDGAGYNWWCVLFPPLCLMEASESEEVEYKFFVQELIDKYF